MAYGLICPWFDFFKTNEESINVPVVPLKWNNVGYAPSTNTPSDYVLNYASGRSTPFQISLHASRINDWYSNKSWIDASAIPSVRSATRLNTTVSFNAVMRDDTGELPDKVLPITCSLNVTLPDVDIFTDDATLKMMLTAAMGSLFTAQTGKDPYSDLIKRYKGVLVPGGVLTPEK